MAVIRAENGQRAKAKLQSVSVTGGMLALVKPLDTGDFIEIAFSTQAGAINGMAEMLDPTRRFDNGCLQPFRFIALGDDDHRRLRTALDTEMDRNFLGKQSAQFMSSKG